MQLQMIEPEVPPCGPEVRERIPRILLVEDDSDMSRLIAAVLRRGGYDVVRVDSGADMLCAIEAATWGDDRERYDAILSDIQMPDISALEVLDALRARAIDMPIVLMTAYGNHQTSAEARALGALTVLDKPLDWDALLEVVGQAVSLQS